MKKVLIKGAGDLASGIACRLHQCGFSVVMTDLPVPTAVRRTVSFSRAIYENKVTVESTHGRLCHNFKEIQECLHDGDLAVLVDPEAKIIKEYQADVLVDAIIAKKNLGTRIEDAPIVIGVGPGFTAGQDCHCVVETKRGHYLGKCIYEGSAIANTGVPGDIGGYTKERILRAPCAGLFEPASEIGAVVKKGDVCGYVDGEPMISQIPGVVRGLLQAGVPVSAGMKAGDVDPRCSVEHCDTVSDKARAIGGGVLEAILHLSLG
ncbi:MAG: selenium-dependent molybdenum cofactor biosynthesis protein YqeB [Eubacteriales bacterium]|nr:selenium-dependent molybdenum cofactor biosynthesis protein YqeB [Eubacteriales bacterium]